MTGAGSEEVPKTLSVSFLFKVLIPAWGRGGLDPCLGKSSGSARPCEGLGKGQASRRAP